MRNNRIFWLLPLAVLWAIAPSYAEMKGASFILSPNVVDSSGASKTGAVFQLVDSVGQPSPTGLSSGAVSQVGSGFIYGTQSTMAMDQAFDNTIQGLGSVITTLNLPAKSPQARDINKAIKFVVDALAAYDAYSIPDPNDLNALVNALNKTKNAINKLIASGVAETLAYQEMLARAAELTVKAEIDAKALITFGGEANGFIIQARVFYGAGVTEMAAGDYAGAVQSFTKALNQAILAPIG